MAIFRRLIRRRTCKRLQSAVLRQKPIVMLSGRPHKLRRPSTSSNTSLSAWGSLRHTLAKPRSIHQTTDSQICCCDLYRAGLRLTTANALTRHIIKETVYRSTKIFDCGENEKMVSHIGGSKHPIKKGIILLIWLHESMTTSVTHQRH